jgi:hypothetical protein
MASAQSVVSTHGAHRATVLEGRWRPAGVCPTDKLLLLLSPAGLAVGLAPKEWRYALVRAIRPGRPAAAAWVPRSPTFAGGGFGVAAL